ncbi:uncharacterized protein RCO7_01780 [Rhynchosporium graminicola]|uniref:Uncharacterized protein n=1 Tax=Rhynchosporium graminicola TaxID=2792576 RepID=A0A1E1KPY6_9HELO|nr:uncharacterized protein RCO7_01780 [Rhynchosporium commune]
MVKLGQKLTQIFLRLSPKHLRSRPAVKTSPLSRRDLDDKILFARIETNRVASTTYVTVITTDNFFCINNPSDVECTNSTQGVLTKTLKTTIRVTSTVPNSKQAVVTKSGVVTSTTIKTITAAQATQAPGEISVASASISQAPGSSGGDTTRTAPVNSPRLRVQLRFVNQPFQLKAQM